MTPDNGSGRPLWVVKIGGSLWSGPDLKAWLAALAQVRAARIAIVPGGGPFADAVREAQVPMGFGDAAAHRMAILGMEQYAHALLDLEPRLSPAATRHALATADGTLVWLPAALATAARVPESWSVTSDSLAAWLAGELGARRLVLVKSAALPPGPIKAADLAAAGIVDAAMPDLIAHAAFETRCVGSHDAARFAEACQAGTAFGTVVLPGRATKPEARQECHSTSCS
ncbi:amino acid kinase family protein [Arenibaculum pallidiluteum]|uniref:amino acid kinase family protein n=1 Tax=Arenibaculum pallidiluteum TaxID=2812559 RepID=UPI001A972981|nr:aspartate/glutamate/uridylate kinase [Arenibaculum pallidiluteum]